MIKISRAVLFYNKESGQSQNQPHHQTIKEHFRAHSIPLDIIELPLDANKIKVAVEDYKQNGVDLFVAAGGDGTISLVGNALIKQKLRLGILPIGTGNLMARELNIPINLQEALDLITSSSSQTIQMDAFSLGNRYYLLNLSIGLTSEVMKKTRSGEKQRMGILAYLFHFVQQVLGLKLRKFMFQVDSHQKSYRASEILITNGRLMGFEPFEWAENVSVNDGKLDLFIIRAANIFDIIHFIYSIFSNHRKPSPVIKHVRFQSGCRIETKSPIQVQADGDPIGKTPVEIQVIPQALHIIVPHKVS